MQHYILLKKIDKGSSRIRKTLESWHTASINHADNNSRPQPNQYSTEEEFVSWHIIFRVNIFLLSYLFLQMFVGDTIF